MAEDQVVVAGVGDVIISKEDNHAFDSFGPHLKAADIAYVNLEQALADKSTSVGVYNLPHDTKFINGYVENGVDIVSCATNHGCDRGAEGVIETLDLLDEKGIAHVGTGRNAEDARKPAIIECKGVKVGFLNYSTVTPKGYEATDTRPGVNSLDVWTFYEEIDWQAGSLPFTHSIMKKKSMDMVMEDIAALRPQVDVLMVMMHWGMHNTPVIIPEYCEELGHAIIDAGADIIIGSHPHIMKGIEFYKGKPIVYSVGNCYIDLSESKSKPPSMDKFFANMGLTFAAMHLSSVEEDKMKAIMFKVYIENKKIEKLTVFPLIVDEFAATSLLVDRHHGGEEVIDYLRKIGECVGFNTQFEWLDDNEVRVFE